MLNDGKVLHVKEFARLARVGTLPDAKAKDRIRQSAAKANSTERACLSRTGNTLMFVLNHLITDHLITDHLITDHLITNHLITDHQVYACLNKNKLLTKPQARLMFSCRLPMYVLKRIMPGITFT